MDSELQIKILLTIFAGLFGALISRYLTRIKERVSLAFDMHKEINGLEMSRHRRIAGKFIETHPVKNFRELSVVDEEKTISVLMIMRFYQRLWLSVKHGQIKKNLVNELFSEVFYYWYYLSYQHNLLVLDWDAAAQIKELASWMEKHDKRKKFLTERNWAANEYQKRINNDENKEA